MPTDFQIAQKAKKIPIEKIARRLRIDKKFLIPYGKYIIKVNLGRGAKAG